MICMGLLTGAARGIERLRQLDRFLRPPVARRLLGSSRARGASDSTVARVVSPLVEGSVRAGRLAITGGLRGQGEGKLALPDRGRPRIGAVDGASVGPLNASVFTSPGTLELLEDLEPWEKRGQGWTELLVSDGLYMPRAFFCFCREGLGWQGVVKTDEETLTLREEADGLSEASPRLQEGIEYGEGGMPNGPGSIGSGAASGFEWEGLAAPLRIARVWEEPLKGPHRGETSRFDVLTTDLAWSARDRREVAHAQWLEENNGCKALNAQGHAQHAVVRDPGAMARWVLLLLLAFALLQAYRSSGARWAGYSPSEAAEAGGSRSVHVGAPAPALPSILDLRTSVMSASDGGKGVGCATAPYYESPRRSHGTRVGS